MNALFRAGLYVAFSLSVLAIALPTAAADPPQRGPNVIFIVADDLGYAEVGCYGYRDVPTPNIDSLAQNGVRFSDGYVTAPSCNPSRSGLMTGRYQERFHHYQVSEEAGLPLSELTFAQRLKPLGYATGAVGKWHLGATAEHHPLRRGFDEFFGFLGGSHDYLDAKADPDNPILRGTQPVDEKEYLTDAFAREAVAFIDRHKAEPFFLYVAFNAVHSPLKATPKYTARVPGSVEGGRRGLAAGILALDDAVGAMLAKVHDVGIEDNTIVAFVNDNGGPQRSRNDPLRGGKRDLLEGGIRVHLLMQWKGHLLAGKVYDKPVISLDVLPTAVAAAGGSLSQQPTLDGVNLLPYLRGESTGAPHEYLFWHYGGQTAVRSGNWKLFKSSRGVELYDLAADIGERHDLAKEKPELVRQLDAVLEKWSAEMAAPARPVDQPTQRRGKRGAT
jgi:arylsulfatase A-like enzyme